MLTKPHWNTPTGCLVSTVFTDGVRLSNQPCKPVFESSVRHAIRYPGLGGSIVSSYATGGPHLYGILSALCALAEGWMAGLLVL